jgi:hypothetical protein
MRSIELEAALKSVDYSLHCSLISYIAISPAIAIEISHTNGDFDLKGISDIGQGIKKLQGNSLHRDDSQSPDVDN